MTKGNNYKSYLEEAKRIHSDSLASLNDSMKLKIERFYTALSGEYEYTDSHTGKNVKARTYKKRIDLANSELEDITRTLNIQRRYGKISEDSAAEINEYIHKIYNISIKNNSYLKGKRILKNIGARNIRSGLSELEDRIIEGPDISTRAETRCTIDFKSQNENTERNLPKRYAYWEYADPKDAKLPDGAHTVWPNPPEYYKNVDSRNRIKHGIRKAFKGLRLAFGMGTLFAGLFISSDNTSNIQTETHPMLSYIAKPSEYNYRTPAKNKEEPKEYHSIFSLNTKHSIKVPTKQINAKTYSYTPKVFRLSDQPKESEYVDGKTSSNVIMEAEARVRAAKAMLENEARSPKKEVKKEVKRRADIRETELNGVEYDWKKKILEGWEKKVASYDEKWGIAKEIIYYTDRKEVIRYRQDESKGNLVASLD